MQILIDTPYVTVKELARRSGQSESAIRNQIEDGAVLIREKSDSSKKAVLINMVALVAAAADQVDRTAQR